MPKYAQEAKDKYQIDGNQQLFINAVWNGIKKYARSERIAERAAKAFLLLTEQNNDWVVGKDILKAIGIKSYKQNQSYGLWPWLDRPGAGIIEENGAWPNMSYRIKPRFYGTMMKES